MEHRPSEPERCAFVRREKVDEREGFLGGRPVWKGVDGYHVSLCGLFIEGIFGRERPENHKLAKLAAHAWN